MNKHFDKVWVFSFLASCFFMMSCSDDGNKDEVENNPSGQQTIPCGDTNCTDGQSCVENRCEPLSSCGNTNCTNAQTCLDDKCVTFVDAGAACNEADLICHKGNCSDGVCVAVEGACTIQNDCDFGTCTAGKCVLKVGDDCSDTGVSCTDSFCYQGKCTTSVPCELSSECGELGYCNSEKICQKRPEVGENCDETSGCAEGLTCNSQSGGSVCIDENVVLGNACDDVRLCGGGALCVQGTCKYLAFHGEACDETHVCMGDDICSVGVCTSTHGECQRDEDCLEDTYCCTEDACETKNVCLAYGEGPRGTINEECVFKTVSGMFEASVQCDWALGASSKDASTLLVADTPFDSNGSSEIIGRMDDNIRIWNAETCELLQSIPDASVGSGSDQISLADIDNDGFIEILSNSHDKVTTYKWDDKQKKYVNGWTAKECGGQKTWGGASIHDINGDGKPEILYQQFVLQGEDGTCLNSKTQTLDFGGVTIAGDLDVDGKAEAITSSGVVRWNAESNDWEMAYEFAIAGSTFAFADFGTPGDSPESFDFTKLDGKAEIVSAGETVDIYTLSGQKIISINSGKAGAPTIGDFNADKLPEIAIGGVSKYSVFDPKCEKADDNCQDKYTLWTIPTQDADNTVTSSSLFDFDGDGQAEVVYSDECFTRILDGKSGEVLFSSYRMSKIDREYPTISDMDNDESVEIVLMANSVAPGCDPVDALHHGIKCVTNGDCYSNSCVDGYCRCESDEQCNWQTDSTGKMMQQYQCTTPLAPQKAEDGKVCRAYHRNGDSHQGIVVLRDRLDRWVSSRDIWNQHAFSITNINKDGSVPALASWEQNFTNATMNNYRKNIEGERGANTAPDITGKFTDRGDVCMVSSGVVTLNAVVCNRGTKMVARKMPASFYQVGENGERTHLCTSYTTANVPIGGCLPVSCEVGAEVTGKILLVVNDDGKGGKTTVECNESNNESTIEIVGCVN